MLLENETLNLVAGQVTDKNSRPLPNLLVCVYDIDMRSEQLLAETVTAKDGKYEITWLHSQLKGKGVGEADIAVKVFTSENKTLLYSTDIDSVRFNAGRREEINIVIDSAIKRDIAEYDELLKQITFLAGDVAIADLQETKEHRDVTFLSKELNVKAAIIDYILLSHRLSVLSTIEPPFFYALFRKNTLFKKNSSSSITNRYSIDLNSDPQVLLYDAALLDPEIILNDIKQAAAEMIISQQIAAESKRYLEILLKYKDEAQKYYQSEYPKKALETVARFIAEGKIQEMGKLFKENINDMNGFLNKITDPSFFSSPEKNNNAKTNIALGELLGFGSDIIPQVINSMEIKTPGDIKKLAKLNKAQWVQQLTKATSNGGNQDAISLIASGIVRKLENAYPTTAFTAQLERETTPVLQHHENIRSFLTRNEDFDLSNDNIDLYVKEKRIPENETAAFKNELKSVQRVFKLVPHYAKTNALLKENIHSAQSIVAAGETRFVKEIAPKSGIEPTEAKAIFKKAERINTGTMLMVGELQDTVRALDIASLESSTLAAKLEAVSKDFPNLKSLFKGIDTCTCEHCRSVYSPAAYLVELLQFLEKRSVVDTTVTPHVTSNLAKDVLFERRPDLADIDLGCENANTPVKYIDLVCELLEEATAPDQGINYTGVLSNGADPLSGKIANALLTTLTTAGIPVTADALIYHTEVITGSSAALPHYVRDKKAVCKIVNTGGSNYKIYRLRQTLSSAEELDAAPEYVNANAYNILNAQSYAFKLPFDLNHVEATAYFNRFNLSRTKLMKDFRLPTGPVDENIAAEKLRLTDTERKLIVTPKPTLPDLQLIWNAPAQWDTPPVTGNVLDYMTRVDHFLDKTGCTFRELDLLLKLKYIDPARDLFVKNLDLTCDTVKKVIANLNEAALDRIHRFLRLQKKTGWKFDVLDEIISQPKLGNGKLDDLDDNANTITNGNELLIKAACLVEIAEKTGIKIDELTGFYGNVPHTILQDDAPKPLYHQVFLNKAKNGFIDEGLLPEKVNGSQLISNFKTSIAVCLQMKQPDLEKLLPLLPDGNLTFSNLSYLFAASRLIKKLKLKTDDFIILVNLTGIAITDSPQKTLDFVNAVNQYAKLPAKAADIQYQLQHKAALLPDIDAKIKQVLEKLQSDYQANFYLNKSKFDAALTSDEQKAALQTELSKLPGLSENDVKTFVKFIDKDWTNATDAKNFTDAKLAALFNTTQIKNKIDELDAAALTKDQDIKDYEDAVQALRTGQDALKKATTPAEIANANAAIAAANAQIAISLPKYNIASGKNLLKALLDAIAGFLLVAGKRNILEQSLATAFKANQDLIKVILDHAVVQQPAPGKGSLATILQTDTLIDINPAHTVPVLPAINMVAFADQYAALRLLNKMLPLINIFKLPVEQVEWFFINNPQLGWFEWDSIPYESAGQLAVDYGKYVNFEIFVSLLTQYPPVHNPADEQNPVTFFSILAMLLPGSTATRNQFIQALALLTGYEKDDLDAIDAYLFPAFSFNNYKIAANWLRLIDCAEDLRTLGSTLTQTVAYIKPALTTADVANVRTALKSRYDEDTWRGTLKEIMDAIRPQKRNALVAYLLAVNPGMKDENDLFDYFMVDVEMEAAMPSSRIVQAHGVIQLYVQRCLMGLEPKATANLDNDANWDQWKWMKNYRVWEANRKVFLYPENWIEPDLRDNKSFLFTELENELKQNELTAVTAESALIKYLEKLDNIAFLEVMATWYQVDLRIMHVFARTKGGDPAKYFYRRFEQERYWTPWERVDLDITGDQLLAFVRNNRLCLAWPVYSDMHDNNQGATLPDQTNKTEQPIDKPRKKLKIQLAISEFANNIWQPKKVSKEGVETPSNFTINTINRNLYNMMYVEVLQQVWLFTSNPEIGSTYYSTNTINGIFNITGCKGYPELVFQGEQSFPDFYPDFKDTLLASQRFYEINQVAGDELAVRNGMSLFGFYEILNKTPGNFRLTYPHQATIIDLLVLVAEYFSLQLYYTTTAYRTNDRQRAFKIPLGTLLPYFEEDSKHAYVIIPGFYKRTSGRDNQMATFTDAEKRTASDVFQLIQDITNFVNKLINKYKTTPVPPVNVLIHEIVTDVAFQQIITELQAYEGFDFFYNFLIGKTGNAEIDEVLKKLSDADGLVYGEQFKNMYHPLVCSLRKTLYRNGIPALMNRETQLQKTAFDFDSYYSPDPSVVPQSFITNEDGTKSLTWPIEDLDFTSDGSYSVYNWELFYHVPFLLATRLTQNQRFEEALTWFHYMFNPTGALKGDAPQKYWVTKPFYLNQDADYISQRIDTLLYKIANPLTPQIKELEFAIDQWRKYPFKPDVVARFRPVAYQKALLMKYIDNLTKWGDYLFRQDTMESIAQATQMYILADKLLGPKPRVISPVVKQPYETYNQMRAKIDAFGNALIYLENILPDLTVLPEDGAELPPPPPPFTLSMLYFCIPQNDQMLAVWDLVADRLFKIRHSQNIDGVERSLALFAPPIDPAMLVRAAASGMDISSIIAGLNAPAPFYRFYILTQKATELAMEVRNLGNSLLIALEKKDAESLALLRNELELKVLAAVKDLKILQVTEAQDQIDSLKSSRKVTEERHTYYAAIEKINSKEQLNLDKLEESVIWQTASNIVYALGAGLALIPDFALGASGFGGSPHGAARFGGSALAHSTDAIGKGLSIFGTIAAYDANRASITGGFDRRYEDWKLQERIANKELDYIDKQIIAAEARKEIAKADAANQQLMIDNARKTDEFMRTRFTNKELYDWMIGQISSVYYSAYQLAHTFAKKAERAYKFELGNDDTFISYGYWDSMKKGLQSADQLLHDIKRMETSYLDKNKREYELTKHVSVALLDPLALVRLKATGVCDFDIPEALFDMDHSGQYFRRIKSVSISLPCIAGPYTSVSAKLSLVNNRYRKNINPDNAAATGYEEDPANDERFVYNVGSIQSIAASNAQNDSGMFELNFRDERYMPFEGTGAISSWRLELPTEIRQFDYNTISDVIIHIRYTAREGGSSLKNLTNASLKDRLFAIKQQLNQQGVHIAVNMKHDMPNEWNLLKKNGAIDVKLDKSRLPYMAQTLDAAIEEVMFVAKPKNNPATFSVFVDGAQTNLMLINDWKLYRGTTSAIDLDATFNLSLSQAQLTNLDELVMVIKYVF